MEHMNDDGPHVVVLALILAGVVAVLSASVVCATAASGVLHDLVLFNFGAVVQDIQGGMLLGGLAVLAFTAAILLAGAGGRKRTEWRRQSPEHETRWRRLSPMLMRWIPLVRQLQSPVPLGEETGHTGLVEHGQGPLDPSDSTTSTAATEDRPSMKDWGRRPAFASLPSLRRHTNAPARPSGLYDGSLTHSDPGQGRTDET